MPLRAMLGAERTAHEELKITWRSANEHFLDIRKVTLLVSFIIIDSFFHTDDGCGSDCITH